MICEPPPIRPAIGNQQPARDPIRPPAAVGSDLWGEPNLAIECSQEIRDVDELRLELDDEERARRCVPSQLIDHASFAVDGEGNLGRELPGLDLGEPPRECLMQRSVAGIDGSVELSASPSNGIVDPGIERQRDRSDLGHWQPIGESTLDPRDIGVRRASPSPPDRPGSNRDGYEESEASCRAGWHPLIKDCHRHLCVGHLNGHARLPM